MHPVSGVDRRGCLTLLLPSFSLETPFRTLLKTNIPSGEEVEAQMLRNTDSAFYLTCLKHLALFVCYNGLKIDVFLG